MNVRDAIQQIMKDPMTRKDLRLAEVLSVSVSDRTCNVKVLDSDAEIDDVRLQTEVSNGILYKPSVGSFVVIGAIADFEYVVVMCSALDEVVFLDGSFGGIVKITELVQKLNNLENKVNALIAWGVSVSPPFSPSTPLTPTVVEDLENPLVKHGTV